MPARMFLKKNLMFVVCLSTHFLASTALPMGTREVPAILQSIEPIDANQLASIAATIKLPNGIKHSRQLESIVSRLRREDILDAVEIWKGFIAENRKRDGNPLNLDILIQVGNAGVVSVDNGDAAGYSGEVQILHRNEEAAAE